MGESEGQVVFAESFEGELDSEWLWIRENPEKWRILDGGLEIVVEPGVAGTVRNALVRPAPDR
ncbi:MAG: hypothetical protein OXJ55_17125, partial [Caldilineaceae bacterium]|nr:hypothetical protein [Caldilineaceae bacterium]